MRGQSTRIASRVQDMRMVSLGMDRVWPLALPAIHSSMKSARAVASRSAGVVSEKRGRILASQSSSALLRWMACIAAGPAAGTLFFFGRPTFLDLVGFCRGISAVGGSFVSLISRECDSRVNLKPNFTLLPSFWK